MSVVTDKQSDKIDRLLNDMDEARELVEGRCPLIDIENEPLRTMRSIAPDGMVVTAADLRDLRQRGSEPDPYRMDVSDYHDGDYNFDIEGS